MESFSCGTLASFFKFSKISSQWSSIRNEYIMIDEVGVCEIDCSLICEYFQKVGFDGESMNVPSFLPLLNELSLNQY